jgi:hypothetical protein
VQRTRIVGTVTRVDERFAGIYINLDKPVIRYSREGGTPLKVWYFVCNHDGTAARTQGDPYEHGTVEVYLEVQPDAKTREKAVSGPAKGHPKACRCGHAWRHHDYDSSKCTYLELAQSGTGAYCACRQYQAEGSR